MRSQDATHSKRGPPPEKDSEREKAADEGRLEKGKARDQIGEQGNRTLESNNSQATAKCEIEERKENA